MSDELLFLYWYIKKEEQTNTQKAKLLGDKIGAGEMSLIDIGIAQKEYLAKAAECKKIRFQIENLLSKELQIGNPSISKLPGAKFKINALAKKK